MRPSTLCRIPNTAVWLNTALVLAEYALHLSRRNSDSIALLKAQSVGIAAVTASGLPWRKVSSVFASGAVSGCEAKGFKLVSSGQQEVENSVWISLVCQWTPHSGVIGAASTGTQEMSRCLGWPYVQEANGSKVGWSFTIVWSIAYWDNLLKPLQLHSPILWWCCSASANSVADDLTYALDPNAQLHWGEQAASFFVEGCFSSHKVMYVHLYLQLKEKLIIDMIKP